MRTRATLRKFRTARTFLVERLELRQLLAVDAVHDFYTIEEGTYFRTDLTAGFNAGAVWSYFTDIGHNGANQTYPTDSADRHWSERDYDNLATSFGAWQTATGPFIMGNIDALGASTPRTTISATTALFRKRFAVPDAVLNGIATRFAVRLMCDDGCVGYMNGVEVFRSNVAPGPVDALQFAQTTITGASESSLIFFEFDTQTSDIPLYADGSNVFAVEVHQSSPTSDDMAFDASLELIDAGLKANDVFDAGFTRIYFVAPGANPATTVAMQGDVLDAATGQVVVGRVNLVPLSGQFVYQPIEAEFGGDARFQYVLRDSNTGEFDVATVTLQIAASNDPPIANNDLFYQMAGRGQLVAANGPAEVLLAFESTWRFQDDNTDQNTLNASWNDIPRPDAVPDADWKSGRAILGFGEQNLPVQTMLQFIPDSSGLTIPAYFFRREFDAPNAITESLRVRMLYDDCAVIFINGVEVVRTFNFPVGENWQSRCTSVKSFEYEIEEFRIPALNLHPTGNVIAVELHNQPVSEDAFFDLELAAAPRDLLTNDTDADDPRAQLRVEVVEASQFTPAVGMLDVRPDGSFTFTPASETISGDFSFTYRVIDEGGSSGPPATSNTATATIRVAPCVCDLDQNDDEQVDAADLAIVAAALGDRLVSWTVPLAGDANGDGRVDVRDAILVRNRQTIAPAVSPGALVAAAGSVAEIESATVPRIVAVRRRVELVNERVDSAIVELSPVPTPLTAIHRRAAVSARAR